MGSMCTDTKIICRPALKQVEGPQNVVQLDTVSSAKSGDIRQGPSESTEVAAPAMSALSIP